MLSIYKAKANKNGTACSFSFNSKDQALFINLIKQVGWDESTKKGSFKGGDKCNVKFSMAEIGGLIDTIEKGRPSKGYHSSQNQTIQYTFAPYYLGPEGGDKKLAGFSLSVFRQTGEEKEKKAFQIGFNFGEAVMLREYFRSVLGRMFGAIYSEDKQRYEAAVKANSNGNGNGNGSAESSDAPAKRKRRTKAEMAAAGTPAPVKKDSAVQEADPFADDPFTPEQAAPVTSSAASEEKVEETPTSTNNAQDEDVF